MPSSPVEQLARSLDDTGQLIEASETTNGASPRRARSGLSAIWSTT